MNNYPLKNIAEFNPAIQPVITEFTQKLWDAYGDNVAAVLVYGSSVSGDFHPEISNINITVVFKILDFSVLSQAHQLVGWGHKKKIATPLLLTKEYILNSIDVFPIEYNEIKAGHRLIYGEDIFESLDIPTVDIRLLCEQQIKGKLLHLRQAFIEIGPKSDVLKKILLVVLNDLQPVFRQLIILKGQRPLAQKEAVLEQMAKLFAVDVEPFLAIYRDKHKKASISSNQVQAYFQNFLNQLETIAHQLDSL